MRVLTTAVAVFAAAALSGCATTAATSIKPAAGDAAKARSLPKGLDSGRGEDAYASTYRPLPSRPTALVGATIFTGTGEKIDGGVVLIRDGKIEAVGAAIVPPASYDVIDAAGKFVTPGLIDAHSHLGVYPSPAVPAHSDGNELTDPNTAGVWAEHSVWPQDPGFNLARAGGVTTLLGLPGSGDLIGGVQPPVKGHQPAPLGRQKRHHLGRQFAVILKGTLGGFNQRHSIGQLALQPGKALLQIAGRRALGDCAGQHHHFLARRTVDRLGLGRAGGERVKHEGHREGQRRQIGPRHIRCAGIDQQHGKKRLGLRVFKAAGKAADRWQICRGHGLRPVLSPILHLGRGIGRICRFCGLGSDRRQPPGRHAFNAVVIKLAIGRKRRRHCRGLRCRGFGRSGLWRFRGVQRRRF